MKETNKKQIHMGKYILLFFLLIDWKCIAQKNPDIEGHYISVNQNYKELYFASGRFLFHYLRDVGTGLCGDTIGYGTWSRLENSTFLQLSSDIDQGRSVVDINVNEWIDRASSKVRFVFHSPIELNQATINKDVRLIEYRLNLLTNCIEFQAETIQKKYDSANVSLKFPQDCVLNEFSIMIYPKDFLIGWDDDYLPSVIHSYFYKVRSKESNVFDIYFPHLTYCYMNSQRYNEDYVYIQNANLLKWNGEWYKKKK